MIKEICPKCLRTIGDPNVMCYPWEDDGDPYCEIDGWYKYKSPVKNFPIELLNVPAWQVIEAFMQHYEEWSNA